MSISDFITLFKPYGISGLIIAVLIGTIAILYRQQQKMQIAQLTDCQDRTKRLEDEVRTLTHDIQQYLVTGMLVRQTMQTAAQELEVTQHAGNGLMP